MSGADIRRYRERHALSQSQLAEALGVSTNTIARWERDAMPIRHPLILLHALRGLEEWMEWPPGRPLPPDADAE